jgi:hypothetical protein
MLQLLTVGAAGVPLGVLAETWVGRDSAEAAQSSSLAVPQTLAGVVDGTTSSSTGPTVASPGFRVRHVALSWSGATAPRLKTAGSSSGNDTWLRAHHGCADGPDGSPRRAAALLLLDDAPTSVEVDLPPGARAVLLNTGDGKVRHVPAQHRDLYRRCAGVEYLSRARWGADESLRFGADTIESWPPAFHPLQAITVHHTATSVDPTDPAATVRAIYHFHAVERGWGDIGYHFLIDPAGRIYEGRYSGTDQIPGFDEAGRAVVAGHVRGYNAGNVGIALLGDFTSALPTSEARTSLGLLLTMLCALGQVSPQKTVAYQNPISGVTASVLGITGHRDWPIATECPGDSFHPVLDDVRAEVDARLAVIHSVEAAHLVETPATTSQGSRP